MDLDDKPVRVSITLRMTAPDTVVLESRSFGLKPTFVVTADVNGDDEAYEELKFIVETYGVGTDKSDIYELANMLDTLAEMLKDKAEQLWADNASGEAASKEP